jgi:exonuclease I
MGKRRSKKIVLKNGTVCRYVEKYVNNPYRLEIDVETSGLKHNADQILSLYGLVKNSEGNVIEEISSYCRSENFRISSPKALMVNNIKAEKLLFSNHPLSVAQRLYKLILKYSPLDLFAFNSSFDFKFLYSAFFQSLQIDPYIMKKNRNSLICAMQIVRAIEAFFDSDVIKVPRLKGELSFRQEDICAASAIFYNAHSSKGDVSGMSKLLNLVEQNHPEVLRKAKLFSNKQYSLDFIYSRPFFLAAIGYRDRFSIRCLSPICHLKGDSSVICLDIGLLSPHELKGSCTYSSSELIHKLVENPKLNSPFVRLPVNKSILLFDETYWQASHTGSKLSLSELEDRAALALKNVELQELVNRSLLFEKHRLSNLDHVLLEDRIYEGFTSYAEERFLRNFASTPIEDKYKFLQTEEIFKKNRFYQLGKRYLLGAFPEFCPKEKVISYEDWCRDMLTDNLNPRTRSFKDALEELDEIKRDPNNDSDQIRQVEIYLESKRNFLNLEKV